MGGLTCPVAAPASVTPPSSGGSLDPRATTFDPKKNKSRVLSAFRKNHAIVAGPGQPQAATPTKSSLGLHKVNNVATLPPRATVIFIHGLGGHPFKTWSFERNIENVSS